MRRGGTTRALRTLLLIVALVCMTPSMAGAIEPPNVVLIMLDDARADLLSSDTAPEIKRRLMRRGVTFSHAMVPVSLCCPSRASTLTGMYSHTTGSYRGGIGSVADDRHTLPVWLRRAGYQTGLFGKYLNGYGKGRFSGYLPPGWDRWVAFRKPGFSRFDWFDQHGRLHDGRGYATRFLGREAERFILDASSRRPLFVYFAPYAVHAPAEPAAKDAGSFGDLAPWRPPSYDVDPIDQPPFLTRPWTPAQRRATDRFRIAQHETLRSADRAFEGIVEALAQAGRVHDTLFVLMSDNGIQWGEHRLDSKSVPYDASTHIPLIMRYDRAGWRGLRRGVAANIDIAPTIAAITGVPHRRVEGRSLVRSLESDIPVREFLLLEHVTGPRGGVPAYCGVRSERYLFVHYADGFEELYDYMADPWELDNIAADRPGLATNLRSEAVALCRPRPPGFTWGLRRASRERVNSSHGEVRNEDGSMTKA